MGNGGSRQRNRNREHKSSNAVHYQRTEYQPFLISTLYSEAAPMIWLAPLLIGLCGSPAAAAQATHSTALYNQFFPAWDNMLKDYLEHNCHEVVTNYRNATFNDTHISYEVFDCLLKQFPEFRKASFLSRLLTDKVVV